MKNLFKTAGVSSVLGGILMVAGPTAFAQTASANFNTNAQVESTCSLKNVSGISFTIDALAANPTSGQTLNNEYTLTCTQGTTGAVFRTDFGLHNATQTCNEYGTKVLYLKSENDDLIEYMLSTNVQDDLNSYNIISQCTDNKNTIKPFTSENASSNSITLKTSLMLTAPETTGFKKGTYTDTITVSIAF